KLKGRARSATVTINKGMMTARIIPKSTPLGILRPPSPFQFFIDLWRVETQQQYCEVSRQRHHQDLVGEDNRGDNAKNHGGQWQRVVRIVFKRVHRQHDKERDECKFTALYIRQDGLSSKSYD